MPRRCATSAKWPAVVSSSFLGRTASDAAEWVPRPWRRVSAPGCLLQRASPTRRLAVGQLVGVAPSPHLQARRSIVDVIARPEAHAPPDEAHRRASVLHRTRTLPRVFPPCTCAIHPQDWHDFPGAVRSALLNRLAFRLGAAMHLGTPCTRFGTVYVPTCLAGSLSRLQKAPRPYVSDVARSRSRRCRNGPACSSWRL